MKKNSRDRRIEKALDEDKEKMFTFNEEIKNIICAVVKK